MPKKIEFEKYGSPTAIVNWSKLGYRYFRIAVMACEKTIKFAKTVLKNHPNVSFVIEGKGWFNLGFGIIAKDNAEAIDVINNISKFLSAADRIVYISEAVRLWQYPNRPITKVKEPLTIVDPVTLPAELTHLELDYLKLVTMDSSVSNTALAGMLNVKPEAIAATKKDLIKRGIIVGEQERYNFKAKYYKVFLNTNNAKTPSAYVELLEYLYNSENCMYICQAISKYNFEFEIFAQNENEVLNIIKDFREYELVYDLDFHSFDSMPVYKTANIAEIKDKLLNDTDKPYDSKLWYLNVSGVQSYVNIDSDEDYNESMRKSLGAMFKAVADYYNKTNKKPLINVVDWGSGNGKVGRLFNQYLGEEKIKAYYPVDIQPLELNLVVKEHANMKYLTKPVILDFEKVEARFPLVTPKNEAELHVFLGGTYGNFKSDIINGHIKKVLNGTDNKMVVSIGVFDLKNKSEEIVKAYSNPFVEGFVIGPLLQFGFKREDFEPNPDYPQIVSCARMENSYLITALKLKHDITILGKVFKKGQEFKITSSWKPTYEEFKKALEKDFKIDFIVKSDDMAIALISAK